MKYIFKNSCFKILQVYIRTVFRSFYTKNTHTYQNVFVYWYFVKAVVNFNFSFFRFVTLGIKMLEIIASIKSVLKQDNVALGL